VTSELERIEGYFEQLNDFLASGGNSLKGSTHRSHNHD
jgi:Asp-tRNA(Asn)/Glu-tRNA(Gln) amidotransferase C subunit